jgi:hypothetical protein
LRGHIESVVATSNARLVPVSRNCLTLGGRTILLQRRDIGTDIARFAGDHSGLLENFQHGQCSFAWQVGMPEKEKIDPPGTDRVEAALAFEVIKPYPIAGRRPG